MAKLFISHATADRGFVQNELLGLLRALGFTVWFAEEDIKTSDQWERSIRRGLESSDWFLLILSPRSAASEWVKDELSWAIEERPGRVVPILVEDCNLRDFHIRLPRIQHVDWRANSKEGRNRLIKVLVEAEYQPHLRKAMPDTLQSRQSRAFWSVFSDAPCQIVMGRHREFTQFEYSGFLGVGDAMAMTELQSHFEGIGLKDVKVSFADRLDGDALKTHLVVLGGPDGNVVAREIVRRVSSTVRFGSPERHEIAFYDSQTAKTYVPSGTGTDEINDDYGAIFYTSNPFYPERKVMLIAGSFGYGTWAGCRFIASPEFLGHSLTVAHSPIECLIHVDVFRETPQRIKLIALRELPAA